jgi:hypothetical protein
MCHFEQLAGGLVYTCSASDKVGDVGSALEVTGFPTRTSFQVSGCSKAFTSLGLDRARLLRTHKTGADAAAPMMLLLHGASSQGPNGFGASVLPVWVDEDKRTALLADLCLARCAASIRNLTAPAIAFLTPRLRLQVLGGVVTSSFKRLMTPSGGDQPEREEVSLRLSVGWSADVRLVMGRFEVSLATYNPSTADRT